MKSFWMILVAIFGLSFSVSAKAGPGINAPSASGASASADGDAPSGIPGMTKAQLCSLVHECDKKVTHSVVWDVCKAPDDVVIVDKDGEYKVVTNPNTAKVERGQCVCPKGFSLTKTYVGGSTRTNPDGSVHKTHRAMGLCMPDNVELNAPIIAEGLNEMRKWIQKVDQRTADHDNRFAYVEKLIDGHTYRISYNAEQITQLQADMTDVKAFMHDACSYSKLSPGWRAVCDGVDELQKQLDEHLRNHWVMGVGAAVEVSHFPENTYLGPALQLHLETPRFAGPMGAGVIGRFGLGRADDIGSDNSPGAAYKATLIPSLVWHLDDDERLKLYTGLLIEQLIKGKADEWRRGRNIGGNLTFSYAPMAELGSPASVTIMPWLNLAYGESAFDRQPTVADPNPSLRGASGFTMGGGLAVGGQF